MAIARRVIDGFGAVLFADLLRLVSMGAVILLVTRLLTPAEYGLFFLAMAILSVATLGSRLGLDKSAARYLTEYRQRDPSQLPYILRSTFGFVLIAISAVVLLLVGLSGPIATALGQPELVTLLTVGAAFVVWKTLGAVCATTFQGLKRVQWSALVLTVESVLKPLLVVLFVVLGLGVVGVLLGYIISAFAAAVLGLGIIYWKFYREYDTDSPREAGLTGRLLRYSVPLTATRSANVLDKRVDVIMVGYFLDPLAVAYYNLAKQISDLVIAPAGSLGFTISPAYGEFKASGELAQAGRIYERSLVYTLAFYLPAVAGLALVAAPTVRFVFGDGYLGAIPVVQLFSVYVLLIAIDKITNDGLDFLGRARARALAKGGASTANFALNLVLIPLFGVMGAAVATVFTTSLLVGVELVVISRELPLRAGWLARRVALVVAVTAGMAVLVRAVVPFVGGIVSLLAVVLLGVAIWSALVTASGLVELRKLRALM